MKLLIISLILNINYCLSQEYFENENLSASLQALTVINIEASDIDIYLKSLNNEILRSNVSSDGFGTKVFSGTVANGIKNIVNLNPYNLFTSPITDSLVDETKDLIMEERRQTAVWLFNQNINKLPDTGTISHNLIKEILGKSSEIDDFTRADVLQNEAIEKLSEEFSKYTKQQIIIETENIVSKEELKKIRKKINILVKNKIKEKSKKHLSGNLKDNLRHASKLTKIAGQQFASAASIANRLGNEELAQHFNNVSSVANVASSIFAASMGNPLAILPAIDGVMGIFGKKKRGGMDLRWLNEALNEIKNQINELSKQIEKNQKEIMEEFEYLRFLNETQLIALTGLIQGDIETCAALIPSDWKVRNENSLKEDFVDLSLPLVYTNYEQVKKTWLEGRSNWSSCKNTLNNFFTKTKRIHNVFTINFALEKKPDFKNIKRSKDMFQIVKRAFPKKQLKDGTERKLLLASPAFWSNQYNSDSHKNRAELVTNFATKELFLNPILDSSILIDPYILERYVGYLLAVYPYYELVDNNNLISINKLKLRQRLIAESKVKLSKALALTNLAMSQQLMLSGEGLIVENDELDTTIKKLSDYKFIAYNMGLVLAAYKMNSSSERLVYIGSINANNEMALNEVLNSWKLGKTKGLINGSNLDPIIKFTDLKKELPLPNPEDIEMSANGLSMDGIMLRYSPHVAPLLKLQEKLMDAIAGFDLKSKRGRLVALSNIVMKRVEE